MAKASARWYLKEGKALHNTAKNAILDVANGTSPFVSLKILSVINTDWTRKIHDHLWTVCPECQRNPITKRTCKKCSGKGYVQIENPEYMEPSLLYLNDMIDSTKQPMPTWLKNMSILERQIYKYGCNFFLALYHSDDMYYERLGWLITIFAKDAADWITLQDDTKLKVLETYRMRYFEQECRKDRIEPLSKIWAFALKYASEHKWVLRMLDQFAQYMINHPWTFENEVSRHGLQAFHPENWYPRGRGRIWDLVHGGLG